MTEVTPGCDLSHPYCTPNRQHVTIRLGYSLTANFHASMVAAAAETRGAGSASGGDKRCVRAMCKWACDMQGQAHARDVRVCMQAVGEVRAGDVRAIV